MSEFYNYAKQSADSSVNWGQVSQDINNMLEREKLIREEKKTAIDEAYRSDLKQLGEAPMGKYQDGNQFIADYSNAATQTALIDNRLLKSGQMDVKTYTFRRQNRLDGTNSLFSLQKAYQANKQAILDGMDANKLQKTANMYAMQMLEQMGDFSKSRAIIDPTTSSVNIGILEPNSKTGIMEISKNVLPVNVAQKLIFNPVNAFDKDGFMEKWHKTTAPTIMASIIASSTTKTGQIIKLEGLDKLAAAGGLDAYKNIPEYTELKNMVENLNKGNYQFAESATVDPNNTMQILTDYSGRYDINSFTKDIKEAKADPKKILVGVDANGRMTMVKDAPHYAEQRKEANDWLLTDYYRGLKTGVEKAVTPQTQQLRSKTEVESRDQSDKDKTLATAEAFANMYSGNPQQKTSGGTYASSSEKNNKVDIGKEGITTYDANGKVFHPFTVNGKDLSPDEFALSVANTSGIPVSQQPMFIKRFKELAGSAPNKEFTGTFEKKEDQGTIPATPLVKFNRVLDSTLNDAFSIKETEGAPAEREYAIANKLNESLSNYGFSVVRSKSPVHLNEISIINDKTGKETFINLRSGLSNSDISKKIKSFTNLNIDEALLKSADEAGLLGGNGGFGKYVKKP